MRYLIDTDICVFYLRGEYSLNQKLKEVQPENCFVSEITIVECFCNTLNIPLHFPFQKYCLNLGNIRKEGYLTQGFFHYCEKNLKLVK